MEEQVQRTKATDEKFCKDCGATIKINAEICPKCGVRQQVSSDQSGSGGGEKDKTTAALLAFFLGGFGAHKFYLGNIGIGVFYLLFFWTFIPSIIAFIEFIILLTMSNQSFNQKYNKRLTKSDF